MGGTEMRDSLDYVERLAARARGDVPPPVMVVEDVLRHLRHRESVPLAWVAMGACAAAAAMMLFTTIGAYSAGDPLDALFEMARFIEP